MTRQQLKSIVKECLLEILQEGLGAPSQGHHSHSPVSSQPKQYSPAAKQPMVAGDRRRVNPLDLPATPYGQKKPGSNMADIIKAEARGNPIMANILADTAMNTLPKMMSGGDSSVLSEGNRSQHSISQQEQFSGTPEQIFGEEVASRWANLAFTDSSAKKST